MLSAGIGPLGTPLEIVMILLALVGVGALAAAVALQQSAGFPWLIAGAALVGAYVALRLRTSWLGLLAAGDGLVAVGAALLATLAERRLRPPQPAPPPGAAAPPLPDPRLPPDDFPVSRAPGERELGWLATALAAASVFPVFQQSIPIHWGVVGPLLGSLLLLGRARQGGPTQALAAAALFSTTIAVALTRLQVVSHAAYAVPIGGSVAIWVQVYRYRLGIDAMARAVPPLAVGGVCALQMFQAPSLVPAALLGAVGLLMLPASRLWRERSYLWIGLCCVATGRGGDVLAHCRRPPLRTRPAGPAVRGERVARLAGAVTAGGRDRGADARAQRSLGRPPAGDPARPRARWAGPGGGAEHGGADLRAGARPRRCGAGAGQRGCHRSAGAAAGPSAARRLAGAAGGRGGDRRLYLPAPAQRLA
jgi:hypothetical protein